MASTIRNATSARVGLDAAGEVQTVRVHIIDNAVYVAGRRIQNPGSLEQTFEYMREKKGMAWIGLYRPTKEELEEVTAEFSLHPLAVEDALTGHQRSKLERERKSTRLNSSQ